MLLIRHGAFFALALWLHLINFTKNFDIQSYGLPNEILKHTMYMITTKLFPCKDQALLTRQGIVFVPDFCLEIGTWRQGP